MSEIVSTNHQLNEIFSPLCSEEGKENINRILSTNYFHVAKQMNFFKKQKKNIKKEIRIANEQRNTLLNKISSIEDKVKQQRNLINLNEEFIQELDPFRTDIKIAQEKLKIEKENFRKSEEGIASTIKSILSFVKIILILILFLFLLITYEKSSGITAFFIALSMAFLAIVVLYNIIISKLKSEEKEQQINELEQQVNELIEKYCDKRDRKIYCYIQKIQRYLEETHNYYFYKEKNQYDADKVIGYMSEKNEHDNEVLSELSKECEIKTAAINEEIKKIDADLITLESKLAELEIEEKNFLLSEEFKKVSYYPIEYVEAIKNGNSVYFDLTINSLNTGEANSLETAFQRVKETVYRYQDNLKHQDLLAAINNQTKTLKEEIFQLSESTIQLLEKSRQSDINIHSAISALQQAKAAARSAEISSDAAATAAIAANHAMHIARNN